MAAARSLGVFRASLLLTASLAFAGSAWAAWPEFRGPSGQGHTAADELPLNWSESENIAWKTPIPGRGWSSPVVLDDLAWLTTSTEGGRSLRAIAVDVDSGAIRHNVEVFAPAGPPSIHQKNTYASPTPLLESNRVYVHFGTLGTAALDFAGDILWRNSKHHCQHMHGAGGSPVLWQDLLLFSCDGTDRQTVIALDKNSGETVWTKSRGRTRMAFATPLVIEAAGKPQLIFPGADAAASYDPATGEELWRITYDGFSLVPRPVFAQGLVYIVSGFYRPTVFAVRPDGEGDVTETHVVWSESRGAPLTPSPVVVGDTLYMVSDNGIASALDAKTGRRLWQARLGGNFSASPLAAGERIYFTNESGETIVIADGPEFRELARNPIDGRTLASLAVDGDALLLRSDSHLYRIANRP